MGLVVSLTFLTRLCGLRGGEVVGRFVRLVDGVNGVY